MIRRPPRSTLTDTLFPDTTLFRSNIDAVARIFRMRPQGMDGGKVHPTQKPIRLMKWCIAKLDAPFHEADGFLGRSEEHTSELQSLMRIAYAVYCFKKNNTTTHTLIVTS